MELFLATVKQLCVLPAVEIVYRLPHNEQKG